MTDAQDPPIDRQTPDAAGGVSAAAPRVLLVTGMSGAGKTSALKALEDMGFEAVDNIPLSLIRNLVPLNPEEGAQGGARSLAVGIDIRTRDFGIDALVREVDRLTSQGHVDAKVLFLDCDDDELRRRYAATRHRHPLAQDRPVSDGIARERHLISPLRGRADVVLDTTGRSPGRLKPILERHFGSDRASALSVLVTSFSFRQGLPREADLVFDVRFLRNPHYDPDLRPQSGLDPAVGAHIAADPVFAPFLDRLSNLLVPLLPCYEAEGKSYLTIAVGCTGGRHRSVFVTEQLATRLRDSGHRIEVTHRDLEG